MSGARYDEDQVASILRRAAELQVRSGAGDPRSMSLAEVESIGREAGIDAALVRQAARELARPGPPPQRINPLLGAPASLHFEATLAGELPEHGFELLAHEIQTALGEPGIASKVGRSLTWQSTPNPGGGGRRIMITVTAMHGSTRLVADEKLGNLIGGLFGGIVGGVGGGGMGLIAIPIVFAPWSVPLFVGGVLGGSFALARTIFRSKAAQRSGELERLLTRMIEVCEECLDPPLELPAPRA
ncbi:hypothetical protein ACNOYE_20460 [Nannocystaceae bacterium ST9]